MKVVLKAKTGNSEVLFEVGLVPVILGRGDKAHIILNDVNCSRNHCRFLIKDNKLWVEDMKSKNGTFVNAIKIDSKQVLLSDKINIGGTEIRIPTDKNKPETIKILQAIQATAAPKEESGLKIETNPVIDELRHNPLKALKSAPEMISSANRKKITEDRLFKESFEEQKKINPRLQQPWRFKIAALIDRLSLVVALVSPYLIVSLLDIKTQGTMMTTLTAILLTAAVWFASKKFPNKTIGKKIMGVWKD